MGMPGEYLTREETIEAFRVAAQRPVICLKCKFFGGKDFSAIWSNDPLPYGRVWHGGECHRYPPQFVCTELAKDGNAQQPWVDYMYWCGEFEYDDQWKIGVVGGLTDEELEDDDTFVSVTRHDFK